MLGFGYVGVLGGFAGLLLVPDAGRHWTPRLASSSAPSAPTSSPTSPAAASGTRPLLPDVSPNKTVEGLIAGVDRRRDPRAPSSAWSFAAPLGTRASAPGWPLGFVVAITAPLGDLVESMLKRDLGLKDLGALLPGHGGFLDRFDAMLFCLPAAYYLALYLGIS